MGKEGDRETGIGAHGCVTKRRWGTHTHTMTAVDCHRSRSDSRLQFGRKQTAAAQRASERAVTHRSFIMKQKHSKKSGKKNAPKKCSKNGRGTPSRPQRQPANQPRNQQDLKSSPGFIVLGPTDFFFPLFFLPIVVLESGSPMDQRCSHVRGHDNMIDVDDYGAVRRMR